MLLPAYAAHFRKRAGARVCLVTIACHFASSTSHLVKSGFNPIECFNRLAALRIYPQLVSAHSLRAHQGRVTDEPGGCSSRSHVRIDPSVEASDTFAVSSIESAHTYKCGSPAQGVPIQ